MKKMTLLALSALLSFSAVAQQGGFKGGEEPPPPAKQDAGYNGSEDTGQATIAGIRDVRENAWVTLEGNILKKEGGDRYQFRDKTGTISIIAPKKVFDGKEYDSQDLVRISGSVTGKGDNVTVHVKELGSP